MTCNTLKKIVPIKKNLKTNYISKLKKKKKLKKFVPKIFYLYLLTFDIICDSCRDLLYRL